MTTYLPLLETKLYYPRRAAGAVSRPRLLAHIQRPSLSEGSYHRKLTLICAPAGFGKTTLLADWIASLPDKRIAWVSLDRSDNDPALFWSYLIGALQKVDARLGGRFSSGEAAPAHSLLQSPQPPPIESVLMMLLNELTAIEQELVLILDDYHVIETKTIHDGIAFLLSHLPPKVHLIIASRADPPLSLARLRSCGELTELRASDLRFTPDEATAFLKQSMGLEISTDEVSALDQRTEGWIAGLQLAALSLLSLQGHENISDFVAAFSGDDRYIVDYLLEEVLQRQPARIRHFLLKTAILERFNGALCNAVTGQDDGQDMLAMLERGNLFIIPLDSKRQWYRYHHLFADVLQAHALMAWSEQMPRLHERASKWYEQNGLFSEAIRHALCAQSFERAAGLIEQMWPTMRQRQRETSVLGWSKSLPDALIRNRPVLSVAYALVLLNEGQLDAVESRLQDAERCSGTTADPQASPAVEGVVIDDKQLRSLPASIANARAYRAVALKDVSATVTYAQQALELLPDDEEYERGTTLALLGLAYFAEGLSIFKQMGLPQIAIGGTLILAQMSMAQGHLHRAIDICEQSLQLATAQGGPVLPGTPELYLPMSEAHYEQGNLAAANQLLLRGEMLRQQASLKGVKFLWRVVQAQLKAAEGDLTAALDQLDEAEQLYYRMSIPVPNVRPISAMRVRLWVRQGRLTEALDWVSDRGASPLENRGLSVEAKLSYTTEYEHLTLARVIIAQYRHDCTDNRLDQVIELLDRLLKNAEANERIGSIIEILVTRSLAYEAKGDLMGAVTSLKRALTLAEPEGYVRIFAECGPPMARLLQAAITNGISLTYSQQLLTLLEAWGQPSKAAPTHPLDSALSEKSKTLQGKPTLHSQQLSVAEVTPPTLIEPLSKRELDVLRLLTTELSGPEIARELVVAVSTVRTHTKRIYSKLNVTNRRAAIKRAAQLDLI